MYPISEEERLVASEFLPPVVYLPANQLSGPDGDGPTIEMRHLEDGRLALLAYTALDRLARGLGPYQPWVLMPTEKLDELNERENYDVVYLDITVPEEDWRR